MIEDGKSWNVSGAWDGENESFDDVSLWDSEEWKWPVCQHVLTGIGHAERDDVVWNKTGGVQVDDQEPEAGESFLSLERMA